MHTGVCRRAWIAFSSAGLALAGGFGCGGAGVAGPFSSSLFRTPSGGTTAGDDGVTGGGSGFFAGGSRESVDPCSEPETRKFIRISMRNQSADFVHYFLVMVAFVNGEVYPDGGVCRDDIPTYISFGYIEIPEGSSVEFGNYCFRGPALLYFHLAGQFRSSAGTDNTGLGSAIGPTSGTNATFDNFFVAGGALVPIPDAIVFHNPGTGAGASLQISQNFASPCGGIVVGGQSSDCELDAFYYVDDSDLLAGSAALGSGSGRRVPNEIQGTGCQCLGLSDPEQILAPSGVTASGAACTEFLRGGTIEYVFLREDTTPAFPQLVWRVTDSGGGIVQDFDSRANLP